MFRTIILVLLMLPSAMAWAQGPPITLDKPIMLGARKGTVRTYFKHVTGEGFDFNAMVLEGDYNISNRLAVGAEIPVMLGSSTPKRLLGDVAAMLKFQFYRKDGKGKTFRVAAKAKQGFATGAPLEIPVLGMGHHMTYAGLLAAYESLHLGVQSELGYSLMYGGAHLNHLGYKLGVGLPLRKPSYPVNQVTVYLESEGVNFASHHGQAQYGYFTAPGIQYAKKRFTFDLSLQLPIAQSLQASLVRRWVGLAGVRMIL